MGIRITKAWLPPAVLLLAAACGPLVGTGLSEQGGSLHITASEELLGSVQGEEVAEPATFLYSGVGPGGETFSTATGDEDATISGLVAGEWVIEVQGLNSDDEVILIGEELVEIESGSTAEVDVELEPVAGTGSLELQAEWNTDQVIDPSVEIVITDSSDQQTSHAPYVEPGMATLSVSELDSGYYRVQVRLYDGDDEVAGAVEAMRIVADLSSEIRIDFDALNKVGERIEVTGEAFMIAWNPPAESTPDSYQVYVRERGEYEWNPLEVVSADPSPGLTITQEMLDYGAWEFAVASQHDDGSESDLHSSMADDAIPETGWYVQWEG